MQDKESKNNLSDSLDNLSSLHVDIMKDKEESVLNWNVQKVADWLRENFMLPDVAANVVSEGVTGDIAAVMDKSDWSELGVQGLKATKIIAALRKL